MKTRKDKANEYAEMMKACAAYVAESKPSVRDPATVASVMLPLMSGSTVEEFWAIHLNAKNNMIGAPVMLSRGLLDSAPVGVRETFRGAIVANAKAIIIVHNHPSGDATPSSEDLQITRRIAEAGRILGVKVMDHVVMGQKTAENSTVYISLRERGLVTFDA
jgi:DNA repair protein RadC